MNDVLLFALLLAAVAAGWWLGRSGRSSQSPQDAARSTYYKGLNYLLDARDDGAIDAFIDGLEVNSETVETHLALGSLLRRRGEADRAVRIHQNLLSRPSLPTRVVHRAHLELARDYISAGLLDRAERLLQDLATESVEQRQASLSYLVSIYERQKDWQQAIASASATLPKKTLLASSPAADEAREQQKTRRAVAHYYCELAEECMRQNQWRQARQLLAQAMQRDRRCARASLLLGELEYRCGKYRAAIRTLRQIRQQDATAIPYSVSLLRQCYDALDDSTSLSLYLQQCLRSAPSAALMLALATELGERRGGDTAAAFLAEHLPRYPSLRGVARWVQWQMDSAEDTESSDMQLLHELLQALIEERPEYRCRHCGFSGKQLHWHCPGCQQWGTTASI